MVSQIFVRLFVVEVDPIQAAAFAQMVRDYIAPIADIVRVETKVYWKIPEWFEVFLLTRPFADAKPSCMFDDILTLLGEGWEKHTYTDQAWAVWNPEPSCRFKWQSVRWANVELFPLPSEGR